jgi:hypothetical protein
MAYPDFSELTFAYSILYAVSQRIGGWQVLPNFITPAAEAREAYDVEILIRTTPVFVQFKRSEVMTNRACHEFFSDRHRWSKVPIYRMHLHKNNCFKQHLALQNSERIGNRVFYITSCVPDRREISELYRRGQSLSSARLFLPSEISLPDTHQKHWVSFNRNDPNFAVYSEKGQFSEGKVANAENAIGLLREDAAVSPEQKLEALEQFVEQFRFDLYSRTVLATPSVIRRAAILAYAELDSFLFLVPKKRLK